MSAGLAQLPEKHHGYPDATKDPGDSALTRSYDLSSDFECSEPKAVPATDLIGWKYSHAVLSSFEAKHYSSTLATRICFSRRMER